MWVQRCNTLVHEPTSELILLLLAQKHKSVENARQNQIKMSPILNKLLYFNTLHVLSLFKCNWRVPAISVTCGYWVHAAAAAPCARATPALRALPP